MEIIKTILRCASFFVLLIGSQIFGFLHQPTEMALAIVAGCMGLVFSDLERFKSVKGAGFEAVMREKLEAIIEKETEPYVPPDATKELRSLAGEKYGPIKAVLNALDRPQFTWRYLRGIVKDTSRGETETLLTLDFLVKHKLARQAIAVRGPVWSLTQLGRDLNVSDDFEVAQ